MDARKLRLQKASVWLPTGVLLVLMCAPASGYAEASGSTGRSYAAPARVVGDWIADLQLRDRTLPSFGALRVHDSPALYAEDGAPLFRVVPYQASLAALCLLATQRADRFEIAAGWIDWYLRHMSLEGNPRGVVFDHWYRADGSGETACPKRGHRQSCDWEDASDSNAALFLLVMAAYWRQGGTAIAPERPGLHDKLNLAARVILELQEPNGLTRARADYPVQYLMDNSEVYAGMLAMAEIEERVLGDPAAGAGHRATAARVRSGIRKHLSSGVSRYRMAEVGNGVAVEPRPHLWYPDTTALVWPLLFGVETSDSPVSRAQMETLNRTWNWSERLTDPTGFPWSSVAYAHVLAGQPELARQHSDLVLRSKLSRRPERSDFAWPFAVDDAGWLLLTLRALKDPSAPDHGLRPGSPGPLSPRTR